MRRVSRVTTLLALGAALLLMSVTLQSVTAYNVRYSYLRATPGVIDMERPGHCADTDPASHTFMPVTEAFNQKAVETLRNNGGSMAAIGGFSRKAICLDLRCNWQYYKGLYEMSEVTFYLGIWRKGVATVSAYEGWFNNWASGYPMAWDNISYWGKRQVMMESNGQWKNIEVVTYFQDWVCEYYEYQKSDSVFFPTWINGDVILPNSSGKPTLTHCGETIKVDSQGRLVDVKCDTKFPWWAGLIIAVVCLIVVVTVIIIVWCCCCICDRREEEKKRENKLATTRDNPSGIPSQSEIGMSRTSSARFVTDDDEDEDDDDRSFSRRDSGV